MRVRVITNECSTNVLYPFPHLTNSIFPDTLVSVLLVNSSDSSAISFDTQGVLAQTAKNAYGERGCAHFKLDGSVYAYSNTDLVPTTVPYRHGGGSSAIDTPAYRIVLDTTGLDRTYRASDFYTDDLRPSMVFYPDFTDIYGSYRNIYVSIFTEPGDIWVREVHYQLKGKYTPWTTTVFKHKFQLDKMRSRYRVTLDTVGLQWDSWRTYANPLRKFPQEHPAPDQSSFPFDWGRYTRLIDIAMKGFTFPNDSDMYGDLVRRCANDARVIQTNGIELAAEMSVIAQSVRETLDLAMREASPVTIAGVYLSYKYGLRLTGIGLKSIIDDSINQLQRSFPSTNIGRSRAREVRSLYSPYSKLKCSVEYNYKIIHSLRSDDWRDSLRTWFDSGLFPSLTNAWDLIPMSFVFDWFVRVEDYLNAIDANTYWSLYNIFAVTYSQKRTYRGVAGLFTIPGYTLTGNCDLIEYRRFVDTVAHKPLYFESSPRIFKNYAELTALLVANSR